MRERERERERERGRERERDRQTDRQTDRHISRHTNTQTHRQTDKQVDRQTGTYHVRVFVCPSKCYFITYKNPKWVEWIVNMSVTVQPISYLDISIE